MNDLAKKAVAAGIAAVVAISAACLAKQAAAPREDAPGAEAEAPMERPAADPSDGPGEPPAAEPPEAAEGDGAAEGMPAEMGEGEWSKSDVAAAAAQTLAGCAWKSADGRSSVEIVTGRLVERRGDEERRFRSTLKESWTCDDGRSAALLEAEPAGGGERKDVWVVIDAADIGGRSYMIESDQFEFAKKYYDTYGG